MTKTYSVILIEDSRDDVFLVREALASAGIKCQITVIEDGGNATSVLDGLDVQDLFLVDLNLPKAGGFEIIQMLKTHKQAQGVPIIVMSSSDAKRDRAKAEGLKVSGYFCKPLELDEFMKLGAVVRTVLERAGG